MKMYLNISRGVAAEYLGATASGPMFLDWEFEDNFARVKAEAEQLSERPDISKWCLNC